jgi:hypothetical protein
MTLSTRRGTAALSLFLFSICSCAAAKRTARLEHQLDEHRFQKPLAEVWPVALRLLADRQYELVGKDRAAVGQREYGSFLRRGFETREYSDKRRAAETMMNGDGVRYRVEGTDFDGKSCRVVFFALPRNAPDYAKWNYRDVEMEMDLVWRVEPKIADRIDAAVKK